MRSNQRTKSNTDIGKRIWDWLPVALIPVAASGPSQVLWNIWQNFLALFVE
jgi:hypothetical protein